MKRIIKNLLITSLTILLIYVLYNFILVKLRQKFEFENENIAIIDNDKETPFSISKIIMYSSGYGKNKNTSFSKESWILDILQYTDIAIYISNNNKTLDSTNSIKKLSLENIKISHPKLGNCSIYYLDSLNFGTYSVNSNNKIENSLEFTVLNDSNEDANIGSNTPVFFTDCSNPITLKYVNSNIKENYTIPSNEPIFLNGKLLEIANIPLNNLEATIDLQIKLQSNDNKKYLYNLNLPIILENKNTTIYDGSILIENNYDNLKFVEIEN